MLRHELAPRILPVVLANLKTAYPYHDSHLTAPGEPAHDPVAAHPSFANSFDWHSSVHSHLTAVRLIEYYRTRAQAPADVGALKDIVLEHLVAERIAVEIDYLARHPSYERPYGWAWALLLAANVRRTSDAAIRKCEPQLRRMAQWIAAAAIRWLSVLPLPVRHGVHSNTAFSLALMYDAAGTLEQMVLARAIESHAQTWFAKDRNWPVKFERSGTDFLSPGLTEADLMRRVLDANAFSAWWGEFLPSLETASRVLTPADVPRVADGQIVHLHGLNLSRAGALARISRALRAPELLEAARGLYNASIERAIAGDYLETHWLATFAWDAATSIDEAT